MRTAANRPSLSPILAINFVGALGFSIVLPFLVFLVERLGGNAAIYGLLGATYSAFQLVGAPLLGRWSDRVGRKRILLLSHLGTLASWGVFLVALALPVSRVFEIESHLLGSFSLTVPLLVLFFARALDGATGGNVSVATAYLADVTPDGERTANFGRLSVSSNLGYIAGPAIAGLLGGIGSGEWLPVLAAFLISAAATVIIVVALRDPEPCVLEREPDPPSVRDLLGADQKECYTLRGASDLSARQILSLPRVSRLLTLQFLVFLAFNLYYVAFPVYAATDLGWTMTELGIYFALMSLLMALVQGPVLKRLSRRFDDRALVSAGSLLLAAAFAFFTAETTAVIYLGTVLVAAGNGLMWPSLLAVLSKATERRTQGAVQGFAGSTNAVASILGLLIGGVTYRTLGAGVFVLSTAIVGLVFLLALDLPRAGTPARNGAPRRSGDPVEAAIESEPGLR